MEWSKKLLLVGSLFLVALAVLDDKHGVHSKPIPMHHRHTVNPSEEKVMLDALLYKEFHFEQHWAGTVCKFSNCTNKPTRFTISRLVPQNKTAWPSTNCCGGLKNKKCDYDKNLITGALLGQLRSTWPDLFGDDFHKFWEKKWKDNGACAVDVLTQTQYFQRANDLFESKNFFQALQAEGYTPDDEKLYCVNDMKETIKKATTLKVIMKCHNAIVSGAHVSYLEEISVCANYQATALKTCDIPVEAGKECNHLVYIPKI